MIKIIKEKIKTYLLEHRLSCLILSAILGIVLSKYCHLHLYKFITGATVATETTNPLIFVLLALPTSALLWFFRTHDTRENIHQNELFDALQMLTDEKVVRREIGTERLINLTKKVPEYKKVVKLSFISVLKSFPKKDDNKAERRTYAQYILKWFNDNYEAKDIDLNGCIFDLQDFTISEAKENLFKLFVEKQFKGIQFFNANLPEANLQGANLEEANLQKANLQKANLQGAELQGAELGEANLQGANLHLAYMHEAGLEGANLQGAITDW